MTTSSDLKHEEAGETGPEKKKKDKNSFSTKVVVRRLPASMTEEEFRNAVDPIPEHDYFRFVKADYSFEQDATARAYINFKLEEDVWQFTERFDGYTFVDNKGNEYLAVVEFAPFQKIPTQKEQRRDPKINTIEQDSDYIKFLQAITEGNLQEGSLITVEQVLEEIEAKEREHKSRDKQTTPLLQYMKDRKEEKIKKRQEQREQRKKRDEERKKRQEDERQWRKEMKEKEIRDREKRDKERREKGEKEKGDKEKDEQVANDPEERRKWKKEKKDEERGHLTAKEKRELEKEKRREREEREKERFRKREEERLKRREERRKKEREKRAAAENAAAADNDQVSAAAEGDQFEVKSEKKIEKSEHDDAEAAPLAAQDDSAAKPALRYSDRRKEERLRKEKERQDRIKKKEEKAQKKIEDPDTDTQPSSRVSEELRERSYLSEPRQMDPEEEERRLKEKEERKKRLEEKRRERELERAERRRNKERPDMQIYRPGMGKFSSRTIKKDSNDSPKTSPDMSREVSPSRQDKSTTSSKNKKLGAGSASTKKPRDADDAKAGGRKHLTREYVNKRQSKHSPGTSQNSGDISDTRSQSTDSRPKSSQSIEKDTSEDLPAGATETSCPEGATAPHSPLETADNSENES